MIPFLLFSFFSYIIFMNELTEKVEINNNTIAQQAVTQLDNTLNIIKEYYSGAVQNRNMNWFFFDDKGISNPAQTEVLNIINDLKGPYAFTDYISTYAVINYDANWAISNHGVYPYNELKNKGEYENFIKPYTETGQRIMWINNINSIAQGKTARYFDTNGYFLSIQIPPLARQTKGVLLISLNMDRIEQLLDSIPKEYAVVMMHEDGSIIYSSNEDFASYCVYNHEQIQTNSNHSVAKTNANTYTLSFVSSQANKFTLYIGDNRTVLRQSGSKLLLLSAGIFIINLLLLLLIQQGTHNLYKPVSQLMSYVSSTVGTTPNGKTEFEHLQKSVSLLADSQDFLATQILSHQDMLKDLFLLRILQGYHDKDQIVTMQEYLGLPQEKLYVLIATRFMLPSNSSIESSFEEDAIHMLACEKLLGINLDFLYVPPSPRGDVLLSLISGATEEQIMQNIVKLENTFATLKIDDYTVLCISGVSEPVCNLEEINQRLEQCREALKNSILIENTSTQNKTTFFSDLSQKSLSINGYSLVLEQEVMTAINLCDEDRAFLAVEQFIIHLTEYDAILHEMQLWIMRFVMAILRIPQEAGISMNQIFNKNEGNIFQQLTTFYNMNHLEKFINNNIVIPTLDVLKEFRGHHKEEIYQDIVSLVRNKKGNVSLAEAADILGFHPSYIWKILKSEGNTTFSDFVALEKLALAEHLLLNTDKSISKIAEELEYTNSQNFSRFFNRHKGISPSKFRDINKSDME